LLPPHRDKPNPDRAIELEELLLTNASPAIANPIF